ncbi:hypothetical protein ACGFNU_24460 [Spirillospora sp. NPDC048911]|uniref:hypothetical protein n=1 Tax=Spirillospora sp. NPDC048911 TaxID=3364527 RepID=UPI003721F50F
MMAQRAHHEASLVVRLAGPHTVMVELVGRMIQVMLPGAVITLTDLTAARALYSAWIEGRLMSRRTFRETWPARSYQAPAQTVTAAVRISGKQPEPVIFGKVPVHSPSGRGQVVVRVGALTIVCDDRFAWDSQFQAWRQAYELAYQLWPGGLAPDTLAARVEAKVANRQDRKLSD